MTDETFPPHMEDCHVMTAASVQIAWRLVTLQNHSDSHQCSDRTERLQTGVAQAPSHNPSMRRESKNDPTINWALLYQDLYKNRGGAEGVWARMLLAQTERSLRRALATSS